MKQAVLDPENVRVGATIRALRERTGLTLTELARGADVTAAHIVNIEKGRRRLTPKACEAIAATLNVPVKAIIVPGYDRIADEQAS